MSETKYINKRAAPAFHDDYFECSSQKTISAYKKYLPVLVLVSLGLLTKQYINEWQFMWIFAYVIFLSCKWITLVDALQITPNASRLRAVLYLIFWVGMDARRFFTVKVVHGIKTRLWIETILKILIGLFLVYFFAEQAYIKNHLLGGWVGLIGLGLIIHFGTFHLLALIWNKLGIKVRPIINFPLLSTSLTDFWSNRWNLAYRDLSRMYILRPLAPILGIRFAAILVFIISGLIHELVISLPANGGYGLPTIYFLIQTIGVLIEKSRIGSALGLHNNLMGRVYTAIFVIAPITLLFHDTFINKVIIPFLFEIKSLGGA